MAILLKSLTSGRKRQSWVMLIFLAVVPGCQLPDKFLIRELFLASETEALLPTSRTLRFPFSSAPLSFSLSSLSSLWTEFLDITLNKPRGRAWRPKPRPGVLIGQHLAVREAAEAAGGAAEQGADCLQPPLPSVPRQPRKPGKPIPAPGELASRTLTEHARQGPAPEVTLELSGSYRACSSSGARGMRLQPRGTGEPRISPRGDEGRRGRSFLDAFLSAKWRGWNAEMAETSSHPSARNSDQRILEHIKPLNRLCAPCCKLRHLLAGASEGRAKRAES